MGRCLFVDMNSFFASVEQELRPELRGRPVIVAPVAAETTCAIAASYEAKALGIKTGTSVKAARRLCPEIEVIPARPKVYMDYHGMIMKVLEGMFVQVKVLSVDEMACGVDRLHTTREAEIGLGRELKRRLYRDVGAMMRCSVGVAPNVFLAKVASEMEKPDGLIVLEEKGVKERLTRLHLLDLPGIGARMAARLERHGIRTVRELLEADVTQMRQAWGGVVGVRWWYMLRGSQVADYGVYLPEVRKSVGHSHVLPPELRTEAGVQQILLRLFSKCMKRLRSYGQAAGAVQVCVVFKDPATHSTTSWRRQSRKHLHANDETTWLKIVRPLVESVPAARAGTVPLKVAITFGDLILCQDMNLSLFDDPIAKTHLWNVVDALNAEHGHVVDLASVFWARNEAPDRIAFGRPI